MSLQQKLQSILDSREDQKPAVNIESAPLDASKVSAISTNIHVRTTPPAGSGLLTLSGDQDQHRTSSADTMFFGPTSALSQLAGQHVSAIPAENEEQSWPKTTHMGLRTLSRQIFRQELNLPPEATASMLVEVFKNSINTLCYIINHNELDRIQTGLYEHTNGLDPFDVKSYYLILAISLQVLSKGDPSLSATSAAYFQHAMKSGSCESLKRYSITSFRSGMLICVYMMLRPHTGDIWRMIGFACRVCFDIGNMSKRTSEEEQEYILVYRTLYSIDS